MASFVIHNIAGERFLAILEEKYNIKLSMEERRNFLLGNLIVDSSRLKKPNVEGFDSEQAKQIFREYRAAVQNEKVSTHFRSSEDKDLCIQAPIVLDFAMKYQDLFSKDISVLGYLFHLYTDKMFFNDLFTASFSCLDGKGEETPYIKEVKQMYVKKNGSVMPLEEFWDSQNDSSIYADYTRMNRILLEHYGCSFDSEFLTSNLEEFQNPGIEEVDYTNAVTVVNKTKKFIQDSYLSDVNASLTVFDEEIVKNFIDQVALHFLDEYQNQIDISLKKEACYCKKLR